MFAFGQKEITGLKDQLNRVEQELQKEQGSAARLASFISRIQQFGVSPTGQIPRREFSEALIDSISLHLNVDQVVLFMADPVTLDLIPTAARGTTPEVLARLRVHPGDGTLGKAMESAKPTLKNTSTASANGEDFFSAPYLIFPLRSEETCIGLILLAKPQAGSFNSQAHELAALFAGQAALILENHTLAADLERVRGQIMNALVKAIEAKDIYTHKHSDRTRALVRAFAQELALPEMLIKEIEAGAFLHDLGKIGIDQEILLKDGKLTPQEYAVMKSHPAIGHRILQPIASLRHVAAIVLYHQEWYNGTGYPEGLAGEEIPLGARIVQIIDAWDAMTSDRPYRQAMPKASAVAELRRQEGTQFDPKLVETFLRVIDRLEREGIPTTEHSPEKPLASRPA